MRLLEGGATMVRYVAIGRRDLIYHDIIVGELLSVHDCTVGQRYCNYFTTCKLARSNQQKLLTLY